MPRLFEGENEDPEWATRTEAAIKAAAPDLSDLECRQSQCRGTLSAANEQELVAKTDKLSSDESFRTATAARSILLTAPTPPEKPGGKLSMQIYVRFDR